MSDRTFDLTLSWNPPTTNEDGTELDDLRGYRIYIDTVSLSKSVSPSTEVGDDTTYTFADLDSGRYFISVTAMDEDMNESKFSNIVSVSLGGE